MDVMNERPKEKLTGVEVFVLHRILRVIGYGESYTIIELDEARDGIRRVTDGKQFDLKEGIEELSEIIPSDEVLREEHWFNEPDIEIWNSIRNRFASEETK